MGYTVEIREDLRERMDRHLEEDESYEEFIEELLDIYEAEGGLAWEGYGGPP